MKIILHFTETSTRNTEGVKTSDRKFDCEFDMEDASIIDSTKAMMEVLTNKDFLSTVKDYRKSSKHTDHGTNQRVDVDWSRKNDFVTTITPRVKHWISVCTGSEDDARVEMIADEVSSGLPWWIACGVEYEQLVNIIQAFDFDVDYGTNVDDFSIIINGWANRTGFIK